MGLGVPRGDFPSLRVDDTAVGRTATEHLLQRGHRDIAHISESLPATSPADPEFEIPSRRRRGYEAAMADAGIRAPRFAEADFTIDGGRRAAHALLRSAEPPTAIFAASDEMAYGVLTAARELGLSVPGDLSVIGVDGHDLAGLFDLTTIDQFPHAQGERAGEAILAALEAPTPAEAGLAAASLPFELVVRGSTAGPPA